MALTMWETKVTKGITALNAGDPATEKQIAFITKLVSEKDPTHIVVVMASQMIKDIKAHPLTKKNASQTIDALLALPKHVKSVSISSWSAPAAVADEAFTKPKIPVTVGIYDTKPHLPEPTEVPTGGRWMIVYQSKNGLRCKKLYSSWETKSGFSWKKASSFLLSQIESGKIVKVDLEVVKKLGKTVGFCMYCGLQLSDPTSLFHSYGPTCASHYGLPWKTIEVVQ